MSTEEDKNENGGQESPTTEMPKAGNSQDASGAEAAKSGWSAKKKGVVAGIAAVAVVACIGCGVAAGQQIQPAQDTNQTSTEQSQDNEAAKHRIEFSISAEGWDDNSSPMILHIFGTDSAGNAVDTYHAFTANRDRSMEVAEGSYTLSWVSAINADGSIYKVPEAAALEVGADTAKAEASFEQVPADQVTADDINAILDKVTEAVEKGDATLTGDAGKLAVDKAIANAAASPNANKEQVEAKAEVAGAVATAKSEGKDTSTAKQEAQQKAPAAVTQSSGSQAVSGGSSSGGSTGGSSAASGSGQQAAAHQHSWQAVTKTVHHDAVYKTEYTTVHHDAVYESISICATCGAESPSSAHLRDHMLKHEDKGGTYGSYKCAQEAYDEQVPKQVLVSDAYDETVTTGYRCSCGATK